MRDANVRTHLVQYLLGIMLLFVLLVASLTAHSALANHTPTPTAVTLAGSLQSELGCPSDWQPECANTHLTYDAGDDVWQDTFTVTIGAWEYKAALNDNWSENYGANAAANGANITFTLPISTPVKFYYDHKSHWVTSNQNAVIAVAPGSFQSELGCPGDWQPDCLRSWLQDLDGDGTYTFVTTAIPAGSYEGKVALNESWDVNYGAGGVQGGDNITFTVANTGDTITFSYDAASHLLTITAGGGDDNLAALVQAPVRNPIANDVFYFVMPDRFNNGSPANDQGGLTGDRLLTGFDPTDKGFYHGGDLVGLLPKMDYLKQMGVTAIWMTPMFKNNPVQGSGADVSAAYHGYWITDFTQMDPHFGTNAELQAVVDAAHQRGVKIFFDIIANHTADIIKYQEDQYSYRNKTDFPYKDTSGQAFDDRAFINKPFPPLSTTVSFPYTPIFANPADATIKAPAWLNNPLYYHNRGDSTFSGENSLYGDFFGLDDLFTEQPDVVNGMIDVYSSWITNFNIDGFRIDTVKHVNVEFWQKFAPAILAHAAAQGKPNFFIFGEVFSANPQLLSYYTASGANLPAVLDFQFQQQARSYVSQSGAADTLKTLFENDDYFTDADSNAYDLVTFLGNHDMGRFGYFLNLDNNNSLPDADMLARAKLAHALMYFTRGVPVVYYGDEQGFTGDGGDKDARQDMMPSQVASYNDDKLIGTTATTAIDNFDPTHPLYQTLTQYAALRAANKALRTGAQIQRVSSNAAGIYAFSRIDRDEKIEYVVALNNSGAAATANVPTFYAAGEQFEPLYIEGSNVTTTLTTDANGALSVTVPAQGFVIYKASSAVAPSTAAPAISLPDLTDGKQVTLGTQNLDGNTVPDRLEIKANVTGNQYAEVTFAVRQTGTTTYTVIGVDDNPPYRVFYDASKLPVTTTIDIIAVVNDLNNHLTAAKVGAIKPVFQQPPTSGATYPYAVIHYQRSDNDYGDQTTGNFNDFWGLHLWGDAIDPSEASPSWQQPKPFLGQDRSGAIGARFAWIKLADASKDVNFIVHRGDVKDGTDADRKFNPASDSPEIWLKQGDPNFYTSRAAAQGYVTIHYHRPDGIYTGWGVHLWGDGLGAGVGTTWDTPRPPAGTDDFGLYFTVPISDATLPVNFILHAGDTKDPGPDQSLNPTETSDVWIQSGDQTIYKTQGAAEKFAIIHYHRADGDYGDPTSPDFTNFWGLHVWDGAASPNPSWQEPVKPTGTDKFGIYFKIPLLAGATQLAYIIHRGDTKDPGPDQFLNLAKYGNEVWQLEQADPANPYLLPIRKGAVAGGDLSKQQAHWVSQDTIAWDIAISPGATYQLYSAPDGGLALTPAGITGGTALTLTYDPTGLSDAIKAKFPHLTNFKAFKIDATDLANVPAILRGQMAVATVVDGVVADATGLQIPGVIDALYTYTGTLGVDYDGAIPTLRVWAPTAKSVQLHLFGTPTSTVESQVISMTAGTQGAWSATGDASWTGKYYLYEVEVYAPSTGKVEHNLITDPYSVGLSTNSRRSLIINLAEVQLPATPGCRILPALSPEDRVLYELHVRDFSINDPSVSAAERGTYKAFTHADANGMKHLAALANAGLTDVHLLPVFDFASVDEDKSQWQTPNVPNAAPDSDQQQVAVMATADQDGFNWGYDPYHYGAPEGSYATNPEGVNRIIEFRQMLAALHCIGLRVVMDVVYNHTTASGQADKSVLDKIVPGYYHRLDLDGKVETSTCCQNTATEHAMMEKLMIDTLVRWAKDYGVDGFRFDLMGHHMKANMEHVRDTLYAINPQIYLYGEGWNFGEVANNARGVNATQLNMAGTGIGTFNDRLRDAVRGGGPFDGGDALIANQGFISGLYYDPNAKNTGSAAEKDKLLLSADQIRVGLTGNLADYPFIDRTGMTVTGSMVDYNGSPTGYTQDPQEEIVYVEAHDNQTLFDISQFKHPISTTIANRVREQNLGLDLTLLGQGVPFIHAGEELLRSKSEDGNSYNSGDWFNRLDFAYQSNNWGIGLPPQDGNGGNWPVIQPLLANPALKPSPADIQSTFDHVKALLAIRKSSKLFRLETKADVLQRVRFHNTGPDQIPGLIVMSLSDRVDTLPDLDPVHEFIVVLFNATDETQSFTTSAVQGMKLTLHPLLAGSADSVVKGATFDATTGTFSIPARTTAVFVDSVANITTITIALEAQPNTSRNFRFDGDLGKFKLDNPAIDDGDRYTRTKTFTVEPGSYTVETDLPGSWSLAAITCDSANSVVDLADESVAITATAGEQITCTFTHQHRSSLRVRTYHDRDGNALCNGEPRLSGWKMILYDVTGKELAAATTDHNGTVRFDRLRPGAYTICEELRTGWFNSQPATLFDTFGNQPCYPLTVEPAQQWTAWFGNHTDPNLVQSASVDALTLAHSLDTRVVIDDVDDAGYETDVTAIDEELLIQRFYLPVMIN